MTSAPCYTLALTSHAPKRTWLRNLLDRILAAQALHKQHQALLQMEDHMLADIGITRKQAVEQAAKPVWNAPNHWKS